MSKETLLTSAFIVLSSPSAALLDELFEHPALLELHLLELRLSRREDSLTCQVTASPSSWL